MPEVDPQTTFGDSAVSLTGSVSISVPIPPGVSRTVRVISGQQMSTWIAFGNSGVVATQSDQKFNFGRIQLVIPDGATHMGLLSLANRSVLVQWGTLSI